jgi:hypothetical protein
VWSKLVEACQVNLAKEGVSARVVEAEPDRVPPGLGNYDCGVVGLGAYAHILGRANRIAFMKDLKAHLSPGAPVFVSTSRRPNGSRYYGLIFTIAKTIRVLRGSRETIEVGDDILHCFSHYFVEASCAQNCKKRDSKRSRVRRDMKCILSRARSVVPRPCPVATKRPRFACQPAFRIFLP